VLFTRPLKVIVPPRRVTLAASLTRLMLSMPRLVLLSKVSVP
jgi:hypothetical protein